MDPGTILSIISAVSSLVHQGIQYYRELNASHAVQQKNDRDLQRQGKLEDEMERFSRDIERQQMSLQNIIAIQKPLQPNSTLAKALADFQAELTASKTLLNELVSQDLPSIGSSSLTSETAPEEPISVISRLREQNNRAFQSLHQVYLIHIFNQSTSPRASPAPPDHGLALDAILYSFQRDPFSISPEQGCDRLLSYLNADHHIADAYVPLMEKEGKRWVEDHLKNEDVKALTELQSTLMESLRSSIEEFKRELRSDKLQAEGDITSFFETITELEKTLRRSVTLAKKKAFVICIVGMVKAGKSSFLNSLIGRQVLPCGELPSTACPCRLRHVQGQQKPHLTFNPETFLDGLAKLRRHQYGHRLEAYKHSERDEEEYDPFAELQVDSSVSLTEEEVELEMIRSEWQSLHKATRESLLQFESPEFSLPSEAFGADAIRVLNELNDIARLCCRFRLDFRMEESDWPTLAIEFGSLREVSFDGMFEIIDLPGIGEVSDRDFEKLVGAALEECHAVVPIVSVKEISRDDLNRLQRIIFRGPKPPLDLVICTHFDQISGENIDAQMAAVSKLFKQYYKEGTTQIIPCSSLMALGSMNLLEMSKSSKPNMDDFWNSTGAERFCARKVLGTGNAKANYDSLKHEDWLRALRDELEESGLPEAVQRLLKHMLNKAHARALGLESRNLRNLLRPVSNFLSRRLLEIRRTANEYEQAKAAYEQAKSLIMDILTQWETDKRNLKLRYQDELGVISAKLKDLGDSALLTALGKMKDNWNTGGIEAEVCIRVSSTPGSVKEILTFGSKDHVQEFLRLSQEALSGALTETRSFYVKKVRELAFKASEEHLKSLRERIASLQESNTRIADEILEQFAIFYVDIRQPDHFYEQIRRFWKRTKRRYSGTEAYQAIGMKILQPFLQDQNRAKKLDDFGFILQASVALIATIPWVLGSPFWPWLVKSKTYELELDVITNCYRDTIATPFLETLKSEAGKSLSGAVDLISDFSKEVLRRQLDLEDESFRREMKTKTTPEAPEVVASLVALHANVIAAGKALEEIRDRIPD